MKRFLIVYYSRTGICKKAAERIFELLGGEEAGDIEEIIDQKNRNGLLGALASVKDSLSDNITRIDTVKHLPSGYSEIIIVTPVYAGKITDAIRTYLAAYKTDIQSLKLVVCGISDSQKQGEQIQKYVLRNFAIKAKPLVALKRADVLSGNIDMALERLTASEEFEGSGENEE